MTPALLALSLLLSPGSSPTAGAPTWEKVFEGAGPDAWLSSVWASGRDEWFVAGGWGVAKGTKTGVERKETPGRAVLGLLGESAGSVFAFGAGELILHFDGKQWSEEHIGLVPPKPRPRGERVKDVLYFAYRSDASAPLVAVGPWLVLVRQPDGTWTQPEEKERYRLYQLGQAGVGKTMRPAKCDPGPWYWLGQNLAWFACADGRSFMYEAGAVSPKGKIPKACVGSVTSMAHSKGELHVVCHSTLWRTDGQTWRAMPAPDDQDKSRPKDFGSISVADDCVFVAARHALWRACGGP